MCFSLKGIIIKKFETQKKSYIDAIYNDSKTTLVIFGRNNVDILNIVELKGFYRNENAIPVVKNYSIVERFDNIRHSLKLISAAFVFLEVVNATFTNYHTVLKGLMLLNQNKYNLGLIYFLSNFLKDNGVLDGALFSSYETSTISFLMGSKNPDVVSLDKKKAEALIDKLIKIIESYIEKPLRTKYNLVYESCYTKG